MVMLTVQDLPRLVSVLEIAHARSMCLAVVVMFANLNSGVYIPAIRMAVNVSTDE